MSVVYEETVAELVGCLDKPLVEGWEPVRTSIKEMQLFKREVKTGLFEYKAVGSVHVDVLTAANVLLDLQHRPKWDTLTKDVRPVPLLQHKGKDGWYVAMQLYSPFNQRDYCLERDKYDSPDQKTFAFTLRAVEHATVPVQAAYVRVTESYEGVALRQAGADGASTQFFVHYYDDLKGSSNASWFQWIADKAVPAYYKAFLSACAKYHEEQKKIDRNAAAAANKAIGQGLEDAFRGAF